MRMAGVDFARQEALFQLQEYAGKFGKGEVPIPVPVEQIAEVQFGLVIDRTELGEGTSGQLFVADKRIVINSREPVTRQRFTIGHELGHFCLHRTASGEVRCPVSCPAEREREANYFSAYLLLPMNLVLLAISDQINAAVEIAKMEGWVYEFTSQELHTISQRLADRFLVSKTTMEIFLSKRFALRAPKQLDLKFSIETA
jgi:hypothetical protein